LPVDPDYSSAEPFRAQSEENRGTSGKFDAVLGALLNI
jgi:hypothetical protein